ncbi:MAG: spondin domain-containing protein [Kofleriaceae bacterium]
MRSIARGGLVALAVGSSALGACTGAEDPAIGGQTDDSVSFTVRIENHAPWTMLKSGAQATKLDGAEGALSPGESYAVTFTAGDGQSINFVTKLAESNDWVFSPGPDGIPLYDAQGAPMVGDVTSYVGLWDIGTEIDQEPGVGDATGTQQRAADVGASDPIASARLLDTEIRLTDGTVFMRPAIADMIGVTLTPGAGREVTLTITNRSTDSTLVTSQGAKPVHLSAVAWSVHTDPAPMFSIGLRDRREGVEQLAEDGVVEPLAETLNALTGVATPISPGIWLIHQAGRPLFIPGERERGRGLEQVAEDGDPSPLYHLLADDPGGRITPVGVFDMPIDAPQPQLAMPGQTYEINLRARPGDSLSFATMFVMSNDWFFATPPEGITLFDRSGQLRDGDLTDHITLYDAGTEADQELGVGADTGPQQLDANTGAYDSLRIVREVMPTRYEPTPDQHLRVTITRR